MIRFIISTRLGDQQNLFFNSIFIWESRSDDECNCKGKVNQKICECSRWAIVCNVNASGTFVALTAFYKRNIFEKLDFKATYTFDHYSNKNIGLGLSGTLGKLNMYLLVNNVLEYKDVSKANSIAFQFGFNFVFQNSED